MNKKEFAAYMRERYRTRPDVRAKQIASTLSRYYFNGGRHSVSAGNENRKLEVLTHYGPNKRLGCCWADCFIVDIDLLTLDHKENDGADHRKKIGTSGLYRWVQKRKYPEGFQTLCWNHQMKKEFLRRRELRKQV